MREFEIRDAESVMPDGLALLAAESSAFGIRNVTFLGEQWADGTQRFARPGERLLVATATATTATTAATANEVVGVGGLTWCPHVDGALRVRRFYVGADWRRRGVARAIAETLLDAAPSHSDVVTCNARASDAAPPFWESLGFEPVAIEGITHIRRHRPV